jgi:hypothetical protein
MGRELLDEHLHRRSEALGTEDVATAGLPGSTDSERQPVLLAGLVARDQRHGVEDG